MLLIFSETKRNYAEVARRFPPRQDRCSFCHRQFGRLKSGQKCAKCDRHLCKSCMHNDPKCQCCLALERLVYKREEFKVGFLSVLRYIVLIREWAFKCDIKLLKD